MRYDCIWPKSRYDCANWPRVTWWWVGGVGHLCWVGVVLDVGVRLTVSKAPDAAASPRLAWGGSSGVTVKGYLFKKCGFSDALQRLSKAAASAS